MNFNKYKHYGCAIDLTGRKETIMFYQFDQNNSGGSFDVDENVCHRLFIEADSLEEATDKAESLGCYWDGVENGIDCPCCGDRWYSGDEVDIERYITEGYEALEFSLQQWNKKYGKYSIVEKPKYIKRYSVAGYEGKISFKDIEEYVQFLADEHGWTIPDARIFYKNGTVKEIYSNREVWG